MSKPKLTAYDLRAKQTNVEFKDFPVINKNNGRFICQGESTNGNKMTKIMSKAQAEEAIKNEQAKKGTGWE